jgi:L-threonylcarbamoyladenylate synthase
VEPRNPPFETEVRPADEGGIAAAARLILAGLPVAVPTETVYGLAADATDPEAVERIYGAKGRPSFNPLIVHVRNLAEAGNARAVLATRPRRRERFLAGRADRRGAGAGG